MHSRSFAAAATGTAASGVPWLTSNVTSGAAKSAHQDIAASTAASGAARERARRRSTAAAATAARGAVQTTTASAAASGAARERTHSRSVAAAATAAQERASNHHCLRRRLRRGTGAHDCRSVAAAAAAARECASDHHRPRRRLRRGASACTTRASPPPPLRRACEMRSSCELAWGVPARAACASCADTSRQLAVQRGLRGERKLAARQRFSDLESLRREVSSAAQPSRGGRRCSARRAETRVTFCGQLRAPRTPLHAIIAAPVVSRAAPCVPRTVSYPVGSSLVLSSFGL